MRSRNTILSVITIATAIVIWGSNEASAANGWDIPLNGPSTTTSQTSSSVSLSLSSGTIQTDLDAANATTNPDEAGKVLSQTATITVGNTDGYTVYVSGNTNLTGRNNTNHKIPSITSFKTLGSMSNEWGYYATLGDTEASYNPSTSFKAMTTGQQSVGTGGATTSNVTKKLTLFYGARVNGSAVEDFYGNTVTLSVVAQPRTVTTTVTKFNGITTMQEMTSTICKNAAENDTARLRDTRDGKYYWVTKLKDGNCWMSQNLALDLSTGKTLTSSDSDVSSWKPTRNTIQNVPTGGSGVNTETYSWNLGKYVIINPTTYTPSTVCSINNIGLSACSGQFMAVGSRTPSSDPNFYKTHGATYTATEYDAHYLAGNYYQWTAATAGTGKGISNANASGSICPKNWKLPSSGDDTTKGTFGFMLSQYGLNSEIEGVNGNNAYNIARSPLFFVRGGKINPDASRGALQSVGQVGIYWSSQASSTDAARSLYIDNTTMPSSNFSRSFGLSLRCLVPTA